VAKRLIGPRHGFHECGCARLFKVGVPASFMASVPPSSSDVTRLLQQWGDGDRDALDRLLPLMYEQLRHLAHQRLRREAYKSLNTTALVHDAYLKLVDVRKARFRDRSHFLAMASRLMRRILVDHARARRAVKRGGEVLRVDFVEELCVTEPQAEALVDLDDALRRLEAIDSRQSQIVEQRYFGGMSLEETAEAQGVSLATVKRELRFAHAWLATELGTAGIKGSTTP
jgi:RNA polymerase sigma factor (TIGR02999 family)